MTPLKYSNIKIFLGGGGFDDDGFYIPFFLLTYYN
uniref:Uncharacterized protein n=1 Tax=Anguilla anguilla TaxID=7936 RepID=A0A0E9QQ37_ANGAN